MTELVIDVEPKDTLVKNTLSSSNNNIILKEQLKSLTLDERYLLLNSINIEERNEYIKKMQKLAKEEEDKISQCPVSKQVMSMKLEIQDLRIELQKLQNKTNENIPKCPYSMFRIEENKQNAYNLSETDLCNELTESYTSSFSWWSTIIFIVFFLFVLTAKPSKHCQSFFTTSM